MVTLGTLRGQPRVVELLRRALERGRVAHAYLFTGPEGCGKMTAALALASALNCDEAPGEGCGGRCGPCAKIEAGLHPDVRVLQRQGAARIIPIDTVRREVVTTVGLPPHEARARMFLVEEAGALQGPAANALLKTLEEPPARTHFVLATTAPDQLLPTIRSRCQRVAFQELAEDLRAELAEDHEGAEKVASLAGRLLDAADGSLGDRLGAAQEIGREKGDIGAALRLAAQRLHGGARQAVAGGDRARAALLARRAELVLETEAAIAQHNAHGQLAVEALLARWREVTP